MPTTAPPPVAIEDSTHTAFATPAAIRSIRSGDLVRAATSNARTARWPTIESAAQATHAKTIEDSSVGIRYSCESLRPNVAAHLRHARVRIAPRGRGARERGRCRRVQRLLASRSSEVSSQPRPSMMASPVEVPIRCARDPRFGQRPGSAPGSAGQRQPETTPDNGNVDRQNTESQPKNHEPRILTRLSRST